MRELVSISGSRLELFDPLLPGKLLPAQQLLLGCLEGETPLGCAVVDRYHGDACLSWLYVPESRRNNGVGGLLLDGVCGAVLQEPGDELRLSYEPTAPWATALDGLIAGRGGWLRTVELPCFRLTGDELRQTPLLKGADLHSLHHPDIIPFNDLTPYQLRLLRSRCEQNGLFCVSRADFELADPRRSMVLLDRQQVVGLTLLRQKEPGRLSLDLLYLDQGHAAQGLPLLRQTAAAALTVGEPLQELDMVCVNQTSQAIGVKLLGQEHQQTAALTTAQFTQEFTLSRADR